MQQEMPGQHLPAGGGDAPAGVPAPEPPAVLAELDRLYLQGVFMKVDIDPGWFDSSVQAYKTRCAGMTLGSHEFAHTLELALMAPSLLLAGVQKPVGTNPLAYAWLLKSLEDHINKIRTLLLEGSAQKPLLSDDDSEAEEEDTEDEQIPAQEG